MEGHGEGDGPDLSSWQHATPGNFSTTSASQDYQRPYDSLNSDVSNSPVMPESGYVTLAVVLTLVWTLGTLFNITCFCVFMTHKKLRSPTNLFVVALNVCDFCMSLIGTFMSMTSSWNRDWLYGSVGCVFEGFTVYFLGLTSLYLMAAISFDRYIVIAKPLLRATFITNKVAYLSISTCWLCGFFWAALPLLGWNEYVLEGAGISCSLRWASSNPVYTSYIAIIFVFAFLFPLGVMVFSYYKVYATLRNVSLNSCWDDNSRVARRKRNLEKRTVKIFVILLGSYIGCWTPYAVVSFLSAFQGSVTVSTQLATYPAVLAKSQGVMNPLLYVATNHRFRQEFYKMLPCAALRKLTIGRSYSDDNCDGKKTIPDEAANANHRNDAAEKKAAGDPAAPTTIAPNNNTTSTTTTTMITANTKKSRKLSARAKRKDISQVWANPCCVVSEVVNVETVEMKAIRTVKRQMSSDTNQTSYRLNFFYSS